MNRKHAIAPTDRALDPEQWRTTNPDYEYTPPRTSKSGRVVEVDGGTLYDASRHHLIFNPKGER